MISSAILVQGITMPDATMDAFFYNALPAPARQDRITALVARGNLCLKSRKLRELEQKVTKKTKKWG